MSQERYIRQIRLPEIGESGQARIAASAAEVRGLDGAEFEIRYLWGAGLSSVVHEPGAVPVSFCHERHFRFAASRKVAAGAWRALLTLKHALAEKS
jgi:molybdopterin/thiamine biosynthesis adenylyltransferase